MQLELDVAEIQPAGYRERLDLPQRQRLVPIQRVGVVLALAGIPLISA